MRDGCRKEILGGTSKLILGRCLWGQEQAGPGVRKKVENPGCYTDEGRSTGYPKTDGLDVENDPTGCQTVSN